MPKWVVVVMPVAAPGRVHRVAFEPVSISADGARHENLEVFGPFDSAEDAGKFRGAFEGRALFTFPLQDPWEYGDRLMEQLGIHCTIDGCTERVANYLDSQPFCWPHLQTRMAMVG